MQNKNLQNQLNRTYGLLFINFNLSKSLKDKGNIY